jgi:hypothetical protein
MLFVYPIGIPLFYAISLWRNRAVLNPDLENDANFNKWLGEKQAAAKATTPSTEDVGNSPQAAGRRSSLANNLSDLDIQKKKHEYRRVRAKSIISADAASTGIHHRDKEAFQQQASTTASYELGGKDIARLAFITEMYEPQHFWFEIFECVRKLLLTGIPVFVLQGSSSQIALCMLVVMLSIAVYSHYKPFLADADDNLATFAQWALLMTLFAGLLGRTHVTTDDGYDDDSFGSILILVNSLVLAGALSLGLFDALGRAHKWRCCASTSSSAAANISVVPLTQSDNGGDGDGSNSSEDEDEVGGMATDNDDKNVHGEVSVLPTLALRSGGKRRPSRHVSPMMTTSAVPTVPSLSTSQVEPRGFGDTAAVNDSILPENDLLLTVDDKTVFEDESGQLRRPFQTT